MIQNLIAPQDDTARVSFADLARLTFGQCISDIPWCSTVSEKRLPDRILINSWNIGLERDRRVSEEAGTDLRPGGKDNRHSHVDKLRNKPLNDLRDSL